jgi:predicted glycoside hydrolase/deacetylase ChbG (UPF0249 family)
MIGFKKINYLFMINLSTALKKISLMICCVCIHYAHAQTPSGIQLIVRSDDMGFCHAVNKACMEVYRQGISRTVEVLAPTPWFMEAVTLLQANPEYDVGVHLCLTSEWTNLRWRPLTSAPSLVDADGYFPQFIWKNNKDTTTAYLLQKHINIAEVEAEFRAQIELVKKYLPHVSHLSAHMGCSDANAAVKSLVNKLALEYKLPIDLPAGVKYINNFGGSHKSPGQKAKQLANILDTISNGVYCLVEHPGIDNEEMQSLFHKGYENVGYDRGGVTKAFTSKRVKQVIARRKIKLVSIKEVLQ